jgi:hypothetical protein
LCVIKVSGYGYYHAFQFSGQADFGAIAQYPKNIGTDLNRVHYACGRHDGRCAIVAAVIELIWKERVL